MTLIIGQLVKFNTSARYNEWKKGEMAEIIDILVTYPENQATIYTVKKVEEKTEFWVYEADISPTYEQLRLF